jgi:hypothetical protein
VTWRKDPWPQKPRWVVIPGSLFPGSLFRCSPGGINFQLVERLREADGAYAQRYDGPAERVIGRGFSCA